MQALVRVLTDTMRARAIFYLRCTVCRHEYTSRDDNSRPCTLCLSPGEVYGMKIPGPTEPLDDDDQAEPTG